MNTSSSTRFELRILGVPDLMAPDGRRLTSVLSQPSRLSLLAYLALAPGPVTRAAVVADFWPERDEARARNALSQALFYLRRSLGKETVQSIEGDRLWVPPERLWCDARELLEEERPSEEVARCAGDEVLAGWNADGSQPLQEWLDSLRRRVRERGAELAAARGAETARAEHEPAPASAQASPAAAADVSAPGRGEAREAASRIGSPAPSRRRPTWASLVGSVALVALVFAVVLPLLGRSAGTGQLAVLLPRVTELVGSPPLDPLRLNAEVLASLPDRPELTVVSAGFASSLGGLLGWRETVDAATAAPPDWILEVSVVVSDREAHVVVLVYRGPDLSSPGSASFDLPYDGPHDLAVRVPREIAERVASTVSDVIGS